jgi:hypothetical protein
MESVEPVRLAIIIYPGDGKETMNYTLCVLGLVNVIGAGLSYVIHGGTILPQLHSAFEAFMR